MLSLLLCAAVALAGSPVASLHRTIIHVSPGTSLRQAQAQARAAARVQDDAAAGQVVIQLATGTHQLIDGPIVLTGEDSGIEWRGAPSGTVISAGAALPRSAFGPVPADDPVLLRLPAAQHQQVLRADISPYRDAIGLPGCHRSPMELHTADGTALTVARWPSLADSTVIDGWATATNGTSGTKTFRFNETASYRQPQNATGTVAHGYWSIDYLDSSVLIESLAAGGVAMMTDNTTAVKPPARFFLLNQPEWLDAPSEYWIDPRTALLYLRPPAGGVQQDFVLSVGDGIFDLQDASAGVSFRSLTLIAARGTAIRCGGSVGPGAYGNYTYDNCAARDVVVADCEIWGMGEGAISVTVSPNSGAGLGWQVHRCNISSTGSIAIALRGAENTLFEPV
jgi:hypothetical protein